MYAVQSNHFDCILNLTGELGMKNKKGNTAMHLAQSSNVVS